MKKVELINALLAAVEASKDTKSTKKLLAESISTIAAEYQSSARTSTKEEHPNTEIDGVLNVWCIKHTQYEPATEFAEVAKSKTGYHNKCKVADYQWKDYLAQIKIIDRELSESLNDGDFELAAKLNKDKIAASNTKDGLYTYPTDDEIKRISPEVKEDSK